MLALEARSEVSIILSLFCTVVAHLALALEL